MMTRVSKPIQMTSDTLMTANQIDEYRFETGQSNNNLRPHKLYSDKTDDQIRHTR